MNKINIYIFKPTGKYYTSNKNVQVPKELKLWDDEFEKFVRYNCGVGYEGSFSFIVVVIDDNENDDFFTIVYNGVDSKWN